ncbi:MAG: BON domain-containing protein [Candidatus Omnitrophota bacterium]
MKLNSLKVFMALTVTVLLAGATAFASETDARIESSARQSYVFKVYLNNDAIKITSTDGAVALTGTVAEESHRALATETVASLPGVVSVNDQLVLKDAVPAENSDGWVGMKVKTALLFHRNVNAFKTQVDVKEGVVTLKGEALSQAQKELAGEYAKDVTGVKDVKNEMVVVPVPVASMQTLSEKIDDASITAQVKVALLSHRSTSALNTKVTTNEGVVTVSGIAKNDAEKTLVSKLANDINGVTSVINNMSIAEPVVTK